MQAVIISFDSLAANSLGCYGNDWIETPHWDRFASTGAVFDRHFADTIGPLAGMAWSSGRQASSSPDSLTPLSLGKRLKSQGLATRLITAVPDQAWQHSAEFETTQAVQGHDSPDATPDQIPFAQVVKAGLSAWNDPAFQQPSRLMWLHSAGPKCAPSGFDSLYFEDFEERGAQIADLSDEERAEHPAVYGGAVSLLDYWLGELLAGIASETQPTLIIITAAQGYRWQRIASSKSSEASGSAPLLDDQLIRAPLLLKVMGDDHFTEIASLRSNRLVQTSGLVPTLLDWFGIKPELNDSSSQGQSWLRELMEEVPCRDWLQIHSDQVPCDAIRTADWLCVRDNLRKEETEFTTHATRPMAALYVKPEDIWDVNDIASQQPEVVAELLSRIPHHA